MSGIFILRGMQIRITDFSIAFGEDGDVTSNLSLNLNYDACAAWARIALSHREKAIHAKAGREIAWAGADENAKGNTLEAEFQASMQAVVAAASSMDALYAVISDRFPVDPALREAWRKNRTARGTQVRETLRTTFNTGPKSTEFLGQFLDALYKIRDAALHPSAKHQPPIFHPELGVSTEWRFWTFRSDVADSLTCIMAKVLWDISHFSGKRPIAGSQFLSDFRRMILEVFPDGVPQPSQEQATFWLP
jgi:hypothetical protein